MFEWAMEKEIPILSVYDSFAVQARYADETLKKMNEVWAKVVCDHSHRTRSRT
jgi:hypothetical protein